MKKKWNKKRENRHSDLIWKISKGEKLSSFEMTEYLELKKLQEEHLNKKIDYSLYYAKIEETRKLLEEIEKIMETISQKQYMDFVKSKLKDSTEILGTLDYKKKKMLYDSIVEAYNSGVIGSFTKKSVLYNQTNPQTPNLFGDIRSIEYIKNISITPEHMNFIHGLIGAQDEVGELSENCLNIFHGKEADLKNLEEEIGDLFFYLNVIILSFDLDFQSILRHNMEKLGVRFENGYSDEAAKERADKKNT